MPNITEAGRIFIREGTLLPEALKFESELYVPGWRSVKSLYGYGLGRKIHDAGWTFFCLAYETKATVFGMDADKLVRRAIERILANRELEKFNSLEIVRVASLDSKRFFGIRHVTVSAQSRHIQEGPVIFRVKGKEFEAAVPSGIELRSDPSTGRSGKKLPLAEIETSNPEPVRI